MTTRTSACVLALSLVAAAVPTAAATAKANPKPCSAAKATTLASSSTARIYRVPVSSPEFSTGVVYGCFRSTGRVTGLARETDDGIETSRDVVVAKLSGRYAAFLVRATDVSCKGTCEPDSHPDRWRVRVTDLSSGSSRSVGRGLIQEKTFAVTGTDVTWKTFAGEDRSAPLKAPVGASSTSKSCSARGSKTIVKTPAVRVYRVETRSDPDVSARVYACRNSDNRRSKLAVEYDDQYVSSDGVSGVKVSGLWVVYLITHEDISCKADCPPGYDPSNTELSAINLATRKRRSLDAGDVDPASLKLSGSTVTWTADGSAKSATLS